MKKVGTRVKLGSTASSAQLPRFRVWVRVQGLGLRVQGFGLRIQGSGFRVSGLGFRIQGLWFRV